MITVVGNLAPLHQHRAGTLCQQATRIVMVLINSRWTLWLFQKARQVFHGELLWWTVLSRHDSQSQNDYLRDYLPFQGEYLAAVLQREAPTPGMECVVCKVRVASWRCSDCFGRQPHCTGCFRASHCHLPFHRVEHWTGDHYENAWLS